MKLQEVRLNKGLSQSQLSRLADVKLKTLQYYEQGTRDINKAELRKMVNLCKALGCSLTDILTDEELIKDLKDVI